MKWKKWFERLPNFAWSPKSETANTSPCVVKSVDNVVSYSNTPVPVREWVAKLSTLPSVFSSCNVGTVLFRNDHFAAITRYSDYVHDNVTICQVYYVEGLGHNLLSVVQFCDDDLEAAFCSNICYVRNLEGDGLLTGARESNLYTISISDMATSSPVCLMSKATLTKSIIKRILDLQPQNKKDYENHQPEFTTTSSKEDLDNFFGTMYEEYFKKRSPEVSINFVAQTTLNNEDTYSPSSIIIEYNEAPPLVSSSKEQIPIISNDIVVESVQEDCRS
ncbi:hypothetical protein Tco_0851564 [Tanacetum coccineum]